MAVPDITLTNRDQMEIFLPEVKAEHFENELITTIIPKIGNVNRKLKGKTFVEHLLLSHEQETCQKVVENMLRKVCVLLEKGAVLSSANFETVLRQVLMSGMDNTKVTEDFFTKTIKNKSSGNGTYAGWCAGLAEVITSLPQELFCSSLTVIQETVTIFMKSSLNLRRGYDVDTLVMINIFDALLKHNSNLSGNLKYVREILENISKLRNLTLTGLRNCGGRNVLHMAVMMDSASLCGFICAQDVVKEALNQTDVHGRSPLFYCTSCDVVRHLLKLPGLEHNLQDNHSQTATHFLVSQFQTEKRSQLLAVLCKLLESPQIDASMLNSTGHCVLLRLLDVKMLNSDDKQNIYAILDVMVNRNDFSLLNTGDKEVTLLDVILQKKLYHFFSILVNAKCIQEIQLCTTAPKGIPVMHQVALGGELQDFMALLQHPDISSSVNQLDIHGRPLLFYMVQQGCVDKMKEVLKFETADPNVCNSNGNTTLHLLAEETDFASEGLQYFLQVQGLEINKCNQDGQSCLHAAVSSKNKKFLQILLQFSEKVDFDVKDANGKSALFQATADGPLDILQILLRGHFTGETLGEAFLTAAEDGLHDVLTTFLSFPDTSVFINYQNGQRKCAMHYATKTPGHQRIMHMLLQHKNVDLSLQDADGMTPLMYGVTLEAKDFQVLFQRSKEHIMLQNIYNQTVKEIFDALPQGQKDNRIRTLIYTSIDSRSKRLSSSDTDIDNGITRLRSAVQNNPKIIKEDQEELLFNLDYFQSLCCTVLNGRHAHVAGMTNEHKKLLIQHRPLLVEEVEPRDVTDHLYSKFILTEHQVEEILSFPTRRVRVQALLVTLPRCGPNAFEEFLTALQMVHQGHVADTILDTSQAVDKVCVAHSKDTAVYNLLTSVSECMLLFSSHTNNEPTP